MIKGCFKGKASIVDVIASLSGECAAAVVSSGSRSMPIVTAIARRGLTRMATVVDERSAAFYALGISLGTKKPVMLVCTSGSAVLHYTPAISEAFYRGVPLIVVSADRPADRIDKGDGQTMRQPYALEAIVKSGCDVNGDALEGSIEYIDGLNQICNTFEHAVSRLQGPVHINVHLSQPLHSDYGNAAPELPERIDRSLGQNEEYDALFRGTTSSNVLVFFGQHAYYEAVDKEFLEWIQERGIAVVADVTAAEQTYGNTVCCCPEALFALLENSTADWHPDILVTVGATSLDAAFVRAMRAETGLRHWDVCPERGCHDTFNHEEFCSISRPEVFLKKIVESIPLRHGPAEVYRMASARCRDITGRYMERLSWCDLKAMSLVRGHLLSIHPSPLLSLGNGTTIRNANLFDWPGIQVYANRGINGIDGTIATALGIAAGSAGDREIWILLGDMGFLHDFSSLYGLPLCRRLRVVVFDNRGGEIFRMIRDTRDAEGREELLCSIPELDFASIARGASLAYHEADSLPALSHALEAIGEEERVMLRISTPAGNSEAYTNLINLIYNHGKI